MYRVSNWAGRANAGIRLMVFLGFLAAEGGGAVAEPGLGQLVGGWSGSGRLYYTDGTSEGITCTAYYRLQGGEFSLAIQCRSEKLKVYPLCLFVSVQQKLKESECWPNRKYAQEPPMGLQI